MKGDEYDPDSVSFNSFKIELRNVKRATVAAFCEQLFGYYCNDNECLCGGRDDCKCFIVNTSVPCRVSDIHLAAWRLKFGNTAPSTKLLGMREVRVLWMRTEDLVIQRCAAIVLKETQSWGEKADKAIGRLATLLDLDVVQVNTQLDAQCSIFDDDDYQPPMTVAGPSGVSQRRGSATQVYYDSNDASIQSELKKFLSQPPDHFRRCKLKTDYAIRIFYFTLLIIQCACLTRI